MERRAGLTQRATTTLAKRDRARERVKQMNPLVQEIDVHRGRVGCVIGKVQLAKRKPPRAACRPSERRARANGKFEWARCGGRGKILCQVVLFRWNNAADPDVAATALRRAEFEARDRDGPSLDQEEAMGAKRAGKLLLVEDEHVLRGLIAQFLRAEGYEVVEAADGSEGVGLRDSGAI